MVYHFLIISGENEDFVREILIDGDSLFLDFHKAIQESVAYDQGQLASFFISDDDWEKGEEITLMQMDETAESHLMDQVKLSEYIKEPKDKLIYTFDFFGNRGFFVELLSVSKERTLEAPALVREEGEAPEQIALGDLVGLSDDDMFDLGDEDDFSSGIEEVGLDELDEEAW